MTTSPLDLKARLRMAVAIVGTQSAAAERIGVSQARLSNYVRGENAPADDILQRLAAATGVRLDWLRTGELPVFDRAQPAPAQEADREPMANGEVLDLVGGRAQQDKAFRQRALAYLKALGREDGPPQVSTGSPPRQAPSAGRPAGGPGPDADAPAWPEAKVVDAPEVPNLRTDRRGEFVPLVGGVSAGLAFRWDEAAFPPRTADRYVRAEGYHRGTFAMQVRGASMEPAVAEGCIVLFGRQAKPSLREGRPVLAVYEDDAGALQYTLKYVSAKGGTVSMRPANEELFPVQRIPADRLHRLYPVIGVLRPAPASG